MRRVLDRDADGCLAEALADFEVAEVVHQPQRDLGDLGRERLDLDSVELRDVDLAELGDVEVERRVVLVQLVEDIELQHAQLAVGDEEEVAASAGGVEEG